MVKKTPVRLALDPNRCDRCGKCTRVCKPGALKIGSSYIYVDWRACDECYACVKACERGAITRRESSRKATTAPAARPRTAPVDRASGAVRGRAAATPRPRRATAARVGGWSLLEAAAVLAVLLVTMVGKDAVLNSDVVRAVGPDGVVLARVAMLVVFYALQVATLLFLARRRGGGMLAAYSLGKLDTSLPSKLTSAGLVAVLLVGTRVAGWIYGLMVRALGWNPPVKTDSTLSGLFGPGSVGLLLSLVLVVIVAPVIEEMVFRGVLLRAFDARWGMWPAVLAQAVLFGAYHFNAWLFVPTMMLGVAAGWLALERESLWPAISLHVLYNLVAVVLAFWPLVYG